MARPPGPLTDFGFSPANTVLLDSMVTDAVAILVERGYQIWQRTKSAVYYMSCPEGCCKSKSVPVVAIIQEALRALSPLGQGGHMLHVYEIGKEKS